MSETQNEYETEQEADAEPTPGPTPGPWKASDDAGGFVIAVKANGGFYQIADCGRGPSIQEDEGEANARLIAAAGTAAQEAKEMGYDPQKAVEALPVGLEQARCAIIDLLDGPPGETSAPAVKSAIKRLAFFLGEASNEEVSEIVDDKMLNDALASAEGSEE